MTANWAVRVTAFTLLLALSGCSSVYYATWEKLGKEKRDLLRDHVADVQEEQADAKEQFATTLDQLKALSNYQGGDLENIYDKLNEDYEESVDRADAVRERIAKIDEVANDLFVEWKKELGLISNPQFKEDSRKKLQQTQARYGELRQSLRTAEARMDPVLTKFRDHVLYLKHNLNAEVIGGLRAEVGSIESEVSKLIADMSESINEAQRFLKTL